jgi:two-component system, NarL family, response regulator DesR
MPDAETLQRPRLLIAEGHHYLRSLLHELLLDNRSVEVVAELESGLEAISEGQRLKVELLLIDLQLPDTNGLAVARMLKAMLPSCRVILLINRPESRQVALENGAADTILKDRVSLDLSATLARNIAQGGAHTHGTYVP